jgi:two-component system, NarL family, response regulator DevR
MDNALTTHSTSVFLVEDSEPIRARLAEIIRKIPGVHIVGEAETPASAIDGILCTRPDLVLLDIRLTGGSGIQVLRSVCPAAPGIVFVVLTNHSDPQYRKLCLQSGASHFFDKSTEFDKVKGVIASVSAMH